MQLSNKSVQEVLKICEQHSTKGARHSVDGCSAAEREVVRRVKDRVGALGKELATRKKRVDKSMASEILREFYYSRLET